jgi:hypothetical protein
MTSTRDKLNEAEYFLAQMETTMDNKNAFRYNLSAYISALRSTTMFMQKEYAHTPNFPSWYLIKQTQMKADKILSFFNHQRKSTIHIKPIVTHAQVQFHSPAFNIAKYTGEEPLSFTITASVEESGKPVMQVTNIVDPAGIMAGEASIETQWLFDDLPQEDNPENKDVIVLCKEQLDKISAIVSECEQLFTN